VGCVYARCLHQWRCQKKLRISVQKWWAWIYILVLRLLHDIWKLLWVHEIFMYEQFRAIYLEISTFWKHHFSRIEYTLVAISRWDFWLKICYKSNIYIRIYLYVFSSNHAAVCSTLRNDSQYLVSGIDRVTPFTKFLQVKCAEDPEYRVYQKKRNLGISQEIDIVLKTKDFRCLGI
jgi:hypothetical protein